MVEIAQRYDLDRVYNGEISGWQSHKENERSEHRSDAGSGLQGLGLAFRHKPICFDRTVSVHAADLIWIVREERIVAQFNVPLRNHDCG